MINKSPVHVGLFINVVNSVQAILEAFVYTDSVAFRLFVS